MFEGISTRVLFGVILVALSCRLNAAEQGNQERSRRLADERNNDSFQFQPLKRQLIDLTSLRDEQRLTMPRLHGAPRGTAATTPRPPEFGRDGSWRSLSRYLARLPSRLLAGNRLPGDW